MSSQENSDALRLVEQCLQAWRASCSTASSSEHHVQRLMTLLKEKSVEPTLVVQNDYYFVLQVQVGDFSASLKSYGCGVDKSKVCMVEHAAVERVKDISETLTARIYFYHKESNSVCTECIAGSEILEEKVISGDLNIGEFENVARQLARIHSATYKGNLDGEIFSLMAKSIECRNDTEQLGQQIFINPYVKDRSENYTSDKVNQLLPKIFNNTNLLQKVDILRTTYLDQEECLIHGSLDICHVFVKDGNTKLVDFEHARTGPCAADVAGILSHTMAGYHQHMLTPINNDWHRRAAYKILDVCRAFFTTYLAGMDSCNGLDTSELISLTAGLIGCLLISRTIGPKEVHMRGLMDSPSAEHATLDTGMRLLNAYDRIRDIGMLFNVAFMLT